MLLPMKNSIDSGNYSEIDASTSTPPSTPDGVREDNVPFAPALENRSPLFRSPFHAHGSVSDDTNELFESDRPVVLRSRAATRLARRCLGRRFCSFSMGRANDSTSLLTRPRVTPRGSHD